MSRAEFTAVAGQTYWIKQAERALSFSAEGEYLAITMYKPGQLISKPVKFFVRQKGGAGIQSYKYVFNVNQPLVAFDFPGASLVNFVHDEERLFVLAPKLGGAAAQGIQKRYFFTGYLEFFGITPARVLLKRRIKGTTRIFELKYAKTVPGDNFAAERRRFVSTGNSATVEFMCSNIIPVEIAPGQKADGVFGYRVKEVGTLNVTHELQGFQMNGYTPVPMFNSPIKIKTGTTPGALLRGVCVTADRKLISLFGWVNSSQFYCDGEKLLIHQGRHVAHHGNTFILSQMRPGGTPPLLMVRFEQNRMLSAPVQVTSSKIPDGGWSKTSFLVMEKGRPVVYSTGDPQGVDIDTPLEPKRVRLDERLEATAAVVDDPESTELENSFEEEVIALLALDAEEAAFPDIDDDDFVFWDDMLTEANDDDLFAEPSGFIEV